MSYIYDKGDNMLIQIFEEWIEHSSITNVEIEDWDPEQDKWVVEVRFNTGRPEYSTSQVINKEEADTMMADIAKRVNEAYKEES